MPVHPNSLRNLKRGNTVGVGRPTNQLRAIRALHRLYEIIDPATGAVDEAKLREFMALKRRADRRRREI